MDVAGIPFHSTKSRSGPGDFLRRVWLSDWAIGAYCLVVAALCVVRAPAVRGWWLYALVHLAILASTFLLVRYDRPGVVGFLRCWAAAAFILILFVTAMQIVHQVHPNDYDDLLMRVDRAIGGTKVLSAMASIEHRWLTAIMQLAWMAYYLLPFILGIPLYLRGREGFVHARDALVLGWTVSYLCYFAWPALGPGYFAQEIQVPQPRWEETAVSSQAKALVAALESPDPRHTFPSGHVMVAALAAFYLVRYRLWRWAAAGLPLVACVLFSTLYLRYHYLTDVIAGLALALVCVLIARRHQTSSPPLIPDA